MAGYNNVSMNDNRGHVSKAGLGERGMVSFLVTMVMMAVITLIVVGFTQVARRNSRESLDRQLSSQAFYAAESGVNATRDTIQTALTNGTVLAAKTTCPNNYDGTPITPLSAGVKYTCVLVDPSPTSLVYSGITQQSSTVIPLEAATNFASLNFSWTKKAGVATGNCANNTRYYYPSAAAWTCGFGILRIDLMRVVNPAAPPTDANQMAATTSTFYMSPFGNHTGGVYNAPVTFGGAVSGYYGTGCNAAAGATCGAASTCNVTCTVNFPVSGAPKYYARVTMLYRDSAQLTITGKVAGGAAAHFLNSQAIVDVTGQSQDELRRIQVRLGEASSNSSGLPLDALASSSTVCKRFKIIPGDPVAIPATLCP